MLPNLPNPAPPATTPDSALCAHYFSLPPPTPTPASKHPAAEPPSAGLGSLLSFPRLAGASQSFPVRSRPQRRGRTRGRTPGEASGCSVPKEQKSERDRVLLPSSPAPGTLQTEPAAGSGRSPQRLLSQLPQTHPELRGDRPQPLPGRTRWLCSLNPCAERRSRGRENRGAGSGKSGEEEQERKQRRRQERVQSSLRLSLSHQAAAARA